MPRNTNKKKKRKNRTNFDEKHLTVSIKFKIRISQLFAEIEFKQRSLNQIRQCLTGHFQIWHHSFDQKLLKFFNDFQNQIFSVLWVKWNRWCKWNKFNNFYETYSNLTSFFIGPKILQYFSYFHDWHLYIENHGFVSYKRYNLLGIGNTY